MDKSQQQAIVIVGIDELKQIITDTIESALATHLYNYWKNLHKTTKFLTPRDIETEYGFTIKQLYYWRCKKTGPPYICQGKRFFYKRDDLEKYIKENNIKPSDFVF